MDADLVTRSASAKFLSGVKTATLRQLVFGVKQMQCHPVIHARPEISGTIAGVPATSDAVAIRPR